MEVKLYSPAEVKELLSNMDTIKRFPMICYEKDESNIEGKTPEEILDNAKTMEYSGSDILFKLVVNMLNHHSGMNKV